MKEFSDGFDTIREAREASEATCRRWARSRGVTYPVAATRVVGKMPESFRADPDHYATHHLTEVRRRKASGQFHVRINRRMRLLQAGTERVGGRDVPVLRRGTLLDPDDFEEAPVRTAERATELTRNK